MSVAGNDFNDGLTEATSKRTIQNAINTVTNGGTVHVKPGIYKENIKIEKDVNLISENREKTIIQNILVDWEGIKQEYNVIISGFTLTPGTIKTDCGNVTIRDTTMQYLYAQSRVVNLINSTVTGKNNDGGGLLHWDGVLNILDSAIVDCKPPKDYHGRDIYYKEEYSGITNRYGLVFMKNSVIARNHGKVTGGIHNIAGSLTVVDSVIKDNTADTNGGGIYSKSTLNITNCQITGNKAKGNGGGIYSFNGMLYLEGLEINKNNANYGGGIYNSKNSVLNIRNTLIRGNSVWYKGGGIYNEDLIYIDKLTKIAGNKWYDLSGNPIRSIETGEIIKDFKA